MSNRLGYVPALDGIRGIAILLVLGVHYFHFRGTIGVDVFFVLSGFLITTLLLEELGRDGKIRLRAFYIRRARRLFPALAVMLVVYLAAMSAVGQHRFLAAGAGAFYIANLVIAFTHSRLMQGTHLGGLWSLAQEEQFYLVWPWLLLVVSRSRRIVWLIIGLAAALALYRAILVLHGATGNRIYYGPDTHASGLLIGASLAAARLRWRFQVGEWAGKIGLCALIPAVLFGWRSTGWAVWGEPVFEVAVALLVAAAVSDTEIARGLSNRPLVWIGQRSYSLYLWQGRVLAAALFVFGPGYTARLAGLIASFAAAALSYRFVEQPFRRRRRPGLEPVALPSPVAVQP